MKLELSGDVLLDEQVEVSFTELVELSGLSEAELRGLVENGALVPKNPNETPWLFEGHYVMIVRRVCRLRDDFELDANTLSLAFLMLQRIQELENTLSEMRAKSPGIF